MLMLNDEQFVFVFRTFINFISSMRDDLNPELDNKNMLIEYPGMTARFTVTPHSAWLYIEQPGIAKRLVFKLGRKGRRINRRVINDLQVFAHKNYEGDFNNTIKLIENSIDSTDFVSLAKKVKPNLYDRMMGKEATLNFLPFHFPLKDLVHFTISSHICTDYKYFPIFNYRSYFIQWEWVPPKITVGKMAPVLGLEEDFYVDCHALALRKDKCFAGVKRHIKSAIIEIVK